MVKKKNSVRPESQGRAFIQAARELGCDEDEAAFEDKLRRIVPKPKKEEKAPED